jgi:glycosyltransferase involved in cell wall biosynthesis
VRSLAAALGRAGANVRAVIWDSDANCLRLLPPTLSIGLVAERLRDPAAPTVPWHELPHTRGHWVLMPELMYDGAGARLVEYCHQSGAKLAVVFYDAIPVSHPQFVPSTLSERHTGYLRDFSRADKILPISEASAEAWREFVAAHGLPRPAVRTCLLASDLSATTRVRSTDISYPKMDRSLPVRILCVSTIEARKNHRALLAAYEIAAARTDLTLELRLVGAPYVGAQDLSDEVERFVARHSGRVTWHEQIEYSLLNRLYEECDFTVYPSLLEGFGLPIIESLWFGRPCVCANFGVMAENAAGGGCVMVDVRNIQALADAILALAESPQRRYELALQATTRELKTWDEYAVEVLACLN